MVETSQSARSSWLSRRSPAIRELARFAGWYLQKLSAPKQRLKVSLSLFVFIGSVIATAYSPWAWSALALIGAATVATGLVALTKYVAMRLTEVAQRIAENSMAAVVAAEEREAQARERLEARLSTAESTLIETAGRYDREIVPFMDAASHTSQRQERVLGALEQAVEDIADRLAGQGRALAALDVRLDNHREEVKCLTDHALEEIRNVKAETKNLRTASENLNANYGQLVEEFESRTAALRSRIDRSLTNVSRSLADAHAKVTVVSTDQKALLNETGGLQSITRDLAQEVRTLSARTQEDVDHLAETLTSTRRAVSQLQAQVSSLKESTEAGVQGVRQEVSQTIDGLAANLTWLEAALTEQLRLIEGELEASSGSSADLEREVRDQIRGLEAADNQLEDAVGALLADLEKTQAALTKLQIAHESRDEQIDENLAKLHARDDALEAALSDEAVCRAKEIEGQVQARSVAIDDFSRSLSDISTNLEGQVTELKTLLDQRMGPEFEQRLEAWRNRLDNEINAAVQAGRTEDQSAALEREKRLREELAKLDRLIQRQREVGQKAATEVLDEVRVLRAELESVRQAHADLLPAESEALSRLESQIHVRIDEERRDAAAQLQATADDVSRRLDEARDQLEQLKSERPEAQDVQPIAESVARALAAAEEARQLAEQTVRRVDDDVVERLAVLEEGVRAPLGETLSQDAYKRLSDANAPLARPFERLLDSAKLVRFEAHWLKALGLNMSRTALAYMAHKICQLEDQGDGRIAAPIETIILRQLALRSVGGKLPLQVMEIGTLFGLGAAVLYNMRAAPSSHIELTLIDPLQGYYDRGRVDPVTGVEVSEHTVVSNLLRLGVPREHFRLILDKSGSSAAISEAADRMYDYILIDGDHSTAGVAADFEHYGPMVRPGGLLLFDDYGSPDWPGIQPFVDEMVRTDPEWVWIGAEFKTAILSKKAGRRAA